MQYFDNQYLNYLVLIGVTVFFAVIVSTFLRRIITIAIRRYSNLIKADPTNFSFIKNSLSALVYTAAVIFIFIKIPFLKSFGTALFAGAGVVAAVVAFASQKAFSNIISGVFILIFKPFRIGDTIEISSSRKGIVEEITLRHTVIRDYENRRIIVPNSIISDDIIINSNITDERIRKQIDFSISYDANIDKAMAIIKDEIGNHPLTVDGRSEEEINSGVEAVVVRLVELADFSVVLRAYVWAEGNDNAFLLQCDVLKSIKERFDREGIEIPFPYTTVVFKKDMSNSSSD